MSRFIRPVKNIVRNASTDMLQKPKVISHKQSLINAPETNLTVGNNGFKIATEPSDKQLATVGVYIGAGSRYEVGAVNGVANLFERMAFMGTANRSKMELEKEVNKLGAQINAYTTRDHTVFYARCLKDDVPKAVELLADIIQNSKYGEAELEKEKESVLKELDAAGSNLTDVTFDYLHASAFQGCSLANSVMGSTETIKNITKLDLEDYKNFHYKPGRMVLAGAGGVNHDQLVELAGKHFNNLADNMDGQLPKKNTPKYTGSGMLVRNDDYPLAHCGIALEGVGYKHPDYLPLLVAGNLVGSWDKTYGASRHSASKLTELVYTNDYGHAFQQFNTTYEDVGLWGNYFVCGKMQQFDMAYHIIEEWMRIWTTCSDFEVERAKNNLRSNYLCSLVGTTPVCEDIGLQVLRHGKRMPLAEFDEKIDAIDAARVRKACMDILYDQDQTVVGVGPIEQLPEYCFMRGWFYRLVV